MDAVLWFAVGAVVFATYIGVHEAGHAAAARLIGIPANDIAIRLFEWPAHVALQTGEQWHQPGTTEYHDAYSRHDPHLRWLGCFVAAGFAMQTIAMCLAAGTSAVLGFEDLGTRLVRISIVVNGLYLLADAIGSSIARTPTGDMSSLLRHRPIAGVLTLGLLGGAHTVAVVAT